LIPVSAITIPHAIPHMVADCVGVYRKSEERESLIRH
jgi:hypothetical protein